MTARNRRQRRRDIQNIIMLCLLLVSLSGLYLVLRQEETGQKWNPLAFFIKKEKPNPQFKAGNQVILLETAKTNQGGQPLAAYQGLVTELMAEELIWSHEPALKEDNTVAANNQILKESLEKGQAYGDVRLTFPAGRSLIGSQTPETDYLLLQSNLTLEGKGTTLVVDGSARWFGLATGPGAVEGVSNFTMTGLTIEAKDLVKFYSENAELVKASTNFLPVRKSVVEIAQADKPLLGAYLNNDQYVINFSNNTPGYAEVRNALFPEIQAVLTGEKDPQAALDSFVTNGNQAIEKGQKFSKVLGE